MQYGPGVMAQLCCQLDTPGRMELPLLNGAVGVAVEHCLDANWWRGAQHTVASDHLDMWL